MSTGEHNDVTPSVEDTAAKLLAATELLESVARDRGLLGHQLAHGYALAGAELPGSQPELAAIR